MSDHDHGNYARKVLDGAGRYAHELLEKNNELRSLVARLQVQEQHAQQEIGALRAAGEQAKELKKQLHAAEQEQLRLREELAEARAANEAHVRDRQRLHELLEQVDKDNRRYSDEFTRLQHQANNLANLYVAIDRLHGTLDREQLVEAVKEIAANLIGCEELALFELDAERRELVPIATSGIDPAACRKLRLDGGLIGRAVESGAPVVAAAGERPEPHEEHLTAVVPLRVVDRVIGLIAIFRLLPQKSGIEDLDRELFEVLAAHAGMALYCTELDARESGQGTAAAARHGG